MAEFLYVDNVFIKSKNHKKLAEFYTQNFSLPLAYSDDCVERLQVGTQKDRAMLTFVSEDMLVDSQLSTFGVAVKDIDVAYKEVTKMNLHRDTHIRRMGPNLEYIFFNFRDPDGNLVTLVQAPE
ncbi:VOC family protein [Longirhabdus pacifica]|uniref:VOC family protein n=1 Tax=Longirhabdus pacifica TaxID=2305227 RepID=UPI001008F1C5|nr:VOC family protein [Longirhabdus pacifica]